MWVQTPATQDSDTPAHPMTYVTACVFWFSLIVGVGCWLEVGHKIGGDAPLGKLVWPAVLLSFVACWVIGYVGIADLGVAALVGGHGACQCLVGTPHMGFGQGSWRWGP